MVKQGIKLKDLAALAGVSPTTASLVLNGRQCRVSTKTRSRILETAERYSYYPHGVARSLVTEKTHTLGFMMPDISNPFFTGIAKGIEERALDFAYNIFFCSTNDTQKEEDRLLRMLLSRSVDGLIIAHTADRDVGSSLLSKLSIPIVLIDRDYDMPGISGRLLVDNFHGAYTAVTYLFNQGHRRIASLGGPLQSRSAQDRFNGYCAALEEAGLKFDPSIVRSDSYTYDAGRAMMEMILKEVGVDAVFCSNDLIAVGAMRAITASGLRVPEDIAVVGFDDISLASLINPALTTVRQPIHQLGVQAVELIMSHLESASEEPSPSQKIVLPTELIVRQSA